MADFNLAIPILLQEEGGATFTNDLSDAGGATKFGVTIAELIAHGCDFDGDGDVDADDVRVMTEEQADGIYLADYWDKHHLGDIESQAVAMKAFSLIVNAGGNGAKIVQRAAGVEDDGQFGDQTIQAINSLDASEFMSAIVESQKTCYWSITSSNITKRALTKLGWNAQQQQLGLQACQDRDLVQVKTLLRSITPPALAGNLKFIRGWLNRAENRYGI